MEYAILTMQIPTITCIKLSFLFFYQRIFGNPSKIMLKYLIWFLMFLCIAWGIAFLFSFVFVCGTHFSSFWTTLIKLRQDCYVLDITLWIAITDFVLDVVIFVFPMPLVLVEMPRAIRECDMLTCNSYGNYKCQELVNLQSLRFLWLEDCEFSSLCS